ncbi:TonB-dependent receptor [Bacteroidales bacterium OttesenSCG-928-I21]|nr:TonB-dependent receptor [Bacteroidales bacterium OttesenSCG-928-I21]
MIRKLLLIMFIALVTSAGLLAQSGTLNGTITDAQTGEPIPFANVTIEQGGSIVTGGSTDFDGNFSIKPIPAGRYTVSASTLGYKTVQITNVQIPAGQITFQNFKLNSSAEMLGEIEVVEYKVPLIAKDQTASGGTVTSEDIAKMPGRSAAAVASTVGGVYSEDGEVKSIRGAREEGTVYYIDGVKVRGSSSVPKAALEQVQVITGGLPAQYGDATGGVINMTTKGPSNQFFGGAEVVTSQFLDPYGYNLAALSISGPIISVAEKGSNRKRTLAGFLLSAEGSMIKDAYPSAVGVWRVNDDVLQSLKENPLRLERTALGAIVYNNMEYLQEGDFSNYKARENANRKSIDLVGKIDISPIRDLNFTFGGRFSRLNAKMSGGQMFNYENYGMGLQNNWSVYGRMSQRFRNSDDNDKASVVKNPYYQIQVDYSKNSIKYYNEKFKDNFFAYGHIGYFEIDPYNYYEYANDTVTGLTGYVLENYVYRVSDYTPGEHNPALSVYNEQYANFFPLGDYLPELATVTQLGGLLNGEGAPNAYSLVGGYGTPYSTYSNSDNSQFRVSVNGSADIGGHEFSLGFEFEQRKDSYFGVAPMGLWSLARQLTNNHILEKDPNSGEAMYDEYGFFMDTINYDRLYNASAQTLFDENVRNYLGYEKNSLEWINVDGLNPDDLKLEWFSADELFNQGNSRVTYYGYDHTGKKMTSKTTLVDFFEKVDEKTGRKLRPISAFEPSYIAGYIQDKFAFKDLIFNIGIRVDRYDANQMVLKDEYIVHGQAYTRGNSVVDALLKPNTEHPENISNSAVVYVNSEDNPSEIKGYRDGNVWYNASGVEVENPLAIAGSNGITPYMFDKTQSANSYEDYKPQTLVLPRISFSFPISDDALFFAHYDILSKRPSYYNELNPVQHYYIWSYNTSTINNANLKPEKTVDYELGFQQKLGNSSAIKLSAFYREMRDMQQTIAVNGAYPSSYYTYGNIDFGTVKGFGVTYDLRRTANVTLRASYTLQFAKGTGSSYESGAEIVKSNKPNLRTTIPLDFDQRHSFSVTLDYRYGGKVSGTPYNGPKIGGKNIFANTGVNFVANIGSGTPYTKKNKPENGSVIGSLSGARKPWRATINMRLDRDIRIKLADKKDDGTKEKYGYMNVYLEINNLLNTKNVLNVYSYTGNPDDDGYLNFDEYQSNIAVQTDVDSYINYRNMVYGYNSGNYSLPRTIRLGVQFSF